MPDHLKLHRRFFSICSLFSLISVLIFYLFYYPSNNKPHHYERNKEERNLSQDRNRIGRTEEGEDKPKIRHNHKHHLNEIQSIHSDVIESRLLHLDLKGAPPRVDYLKEVMKIGKNSGITGLIIEWEDSFPFIGRLQNISQTEGAAYTRAQVEEIINFAEIQLDFQVIPLLQTFGHVEFVLKGEDFRHLREVDQDPQAFCPSKSETMEVIKEMIDQVMELHSRARFIHIGCDEVFNLRVCPLCVAKSEFKEDLFLSHVVEVGKYVRGKGRIPIIWDDMLRQVTLSKLNHSGIGSLVEPMVWVYAEDVDRFVGWENWEKYEAVFPVVWGAGAFKGAFGETLLIPPLSRHAQNIERWIKVIGRESQKWRSGVGGIVLTGWMRYDHFSVLCELLPAGIPSLVYNSLQLSTPSDLEHRIKNRVFVKNNQTIKKTSKRSSTTPHGSQTRVDQLSRDFSQILHCPNSRLENLLKNTDGELSFASRCNFPGVAFFRMLFRVRALVEESWELINKIERKRGWMQTYNIRHNYSLPLRVDEVVFTDVPRMRKQLEMSAKGVESALSPIYPQHVILEWIEQNIWEVWRRLKTLESDGERLKNVHTWARRPLKSPKEMKEQLGLLGNNTT